MNKYNIPITEEEYNEMCKFEDKEIDISCVEFRESTAIRVCETYDIENIMRDEKLSFIAHQ